MMKKIGKILLILLILAGVFWGSFEIGRAIGRGGPAQTNIEEEIPEIPEIFDAYGSGEREEISPYEYGGEMY